MKTLNRTLVGQIERWLFQGKILIVYGARQVGKTTLARVLLAKYGEDSAYFNCEIASVRDALQKAEPELLRRYFGKSRLVVLDEAQKVPNIGLTLKIMADMLPELQVIATGSSSFDLANKLQEPLTGRAIHFLLHPLSLIELEAAYGSAAMQGLLDHVLVYGMYPEIVTTSDNDRARTKLDELTGGYLYRDVLELQGEKKHDLVVNLLRALAFQIGSEVSYQELSRMIGVTVPTVQRYMSLLEKSFVIFRLTPYSRNLRNEIGKGQKVYFYDVGVRNSLISNFNPPSNRSDIGGLWENFCVIERMKRNQARSHRANAYFWRTYEQKEVDYLEEAEGRLTAFEWKWSERQKYTPPAEFMTRYGVSDIPVIHRQNYWQALMSD